MYTVRFKTLNMNIDFAMMGMVDKPPEDGGMDLDITDYKVENSIWSITFSNEIDANKVSQLIDNKYLFSV